MNDEVKMICGNCGVEYCMPQALYDERKKDHKGFFCPNGHERYFSGKNELEKARDEITHLRNRISYLQDLLVWTERSRSSYIGHFNRLKTQSFILLN